MQLRKAERKQAKLKIGVSGPSGSGKTYSALLMASGLAKWDKIALIDTENGSGELYSHLGEYNAVTLESPFIPEKYIEAIKVCEDAGMEVIIIDSASHEWDGEGGCLEIHAKMPGNSFANWRHITPRHNAFIQAVLQSKCHVITTTRRKQDYDMGKGSDGKTQVTKVGLKEVQRDGFEYEVTLNFEIDITHHATASKDRTGLFMDQPPFVIDSSIGKKLIDWNKSGKKDTRPKKEVPTPPLIKLKQILHANSCEDEQKALEYINTACGTKFRSMDFTEEQAKNIIKNLPFKD